MKKLTKNIIITFMISSAIFCLGATVFTFIKNNKPKANDSTDILGRGKNYEKWKITDELNKIDMSDLLLNNKFDNNKFLLNIKNYIKTAIKNSSRFSTNSYEYKYTLSYKINEDNTSIDIDLIWYITDQNYFFYDQFKLQV